MHVDVTLTCATYLNIAAGQVHHFMAMVFTNVKRFVKRLSQYRMYFCAPSKFQAGPRDGVLWLVYSFHFGKLSAEFLY